MDHKQIDKKQIKRKQIEYIVIRCNKSNIGEAK